MAVAIVDDSVHNVDILIVHYGQSYVRIVDDGNEKAGINAAD